MAANPISFSEIDAYARLVMTTPTPWEVRLIRRVDSAVLKAAADQKAADAPPPAETEGQASQIPASNPKGIRDLFRGLAARQRAKLAARS